ncbi:MAG: class B sortase [bacterium]|nr:class B sortase [bacterium]
MKLHLIHKGKEKSADKKKFKPVNKVFKSYTIHKNIKRKRKRNKLNIAINLILICGLFYSLGVILYHKYTNYSTDQINNQLANAVASAKDTIDYDKLKPGTKLPEVSPTSTVAPTKTPTAKPSASGNKKKATKKPTETADPTITKSPTETGKKHSNILPQYQKAYEQNKDLIGWIQIDNTTIDYPVMYTKEKDYYERRNFNKQYSENGSIWIDENNTLQSDKRDNNLIIYGHNIWTRDTMFNILHGYEEEAFYNAHPTIHFDSLYEEGTYDIIACAFTKVLMSNEEGFRYYYFTGYNNPAEFHEYMDFLDTNKLYDTGIKADYGDELITLSTCSKHIPDNMGRFIVVAKRRK